MTEPTDAELGKLAEECGIGWAAGLGGMSDFLSAFARAVLAKWAAPQQEAQEPVAYVHVPHYTVEGKVRPVVSFEKYQQDYDDGVYSTRIPLYTAPQQEAQEPALFVSAKQLASLADPSHATAGSYLPARKTRAGLFTMALYTAPQPAPAPLSDDVVKDAARWHMAVLIGNELMMRPEKRTHATAVKAYMDATHSGSDLTGAVDAAIVAQGGK